MKKKKGSIFRRRSLPTKLSNSDEVVILKKTAGGYTASKRIKVDQRANVLNEIIDTERAYLKDLEMICEHVLAPLENVDNDILSQDKIFSIFANIEQIRDIHRIIIKELDEGKDIITIFLQTELMSYYPIFTNNHKLSVDAINKTKKKNRKFQNYLEAVRFMHCEGLSLKDLLIKPVQRICKYPLLFNELKKSTPEDHEDYQQIVDVYERFEGITAELNEGAADIDQYKIMQELDLQLAPQFKGFFQWNQCVFLNKDLSTTVYIQNSQNKKKCRLLLFDEMLCIMTYRKKKYLNPYSSMRPNEISIETIVEKVDNKSDDEELIKITNTSTTKFFLVVLPSLFEKNLWIKELENFKEKSKLNKVVTRRNMRRRNSTNFGSVNRRKRYDISIWIFCN
eukprot:TRINITY_DN8990_c0_g1_i1.p1 TRINITY_DN8990_c0_g1~~TRINITY_DN8990_c0_g1_i1.p1  ORF type:complete len:395 (+),score=66.75 TRINITY_DN8990_c0_g1_i1:28-1212(+)